MNAVSVASTVGMTPWALHCLITNASCGYVKTNNWLCGCLQSTCNSLFYFMFHLIQTIECFDPKYENKFKVTWFLVWFHWWYPVYLYISVHTGLFVLLGDIHLKLGALTHFSCIASGLHGLFKTLHNFSATTCLWGEVEYNKWHSFSDHKSN